MLCSHGVHCILTAITWTLKFQFLPLAHLCCSSSQNMFASFFPGALLFTPSELHVKRKSNGVLMLGSKTKSKTQYIQKGNFDKIKRLALL